jgi:hypothetical protein
LDAVVVVLKLIVIIIIIVLCADPMIIHFCLLYNLLFFLGRLLVAKKGPK